jgi:hypothetical protein
MSTESPVAPKSPKSFSRVLRSGKDTIEFRNEIHADGSVRAIVIVREDGKVVSRGGSVKYANLELAKAAMAKPLADALAKGWEKPAAVDIAKYGFKAKPDAFSLADLPAPRSKK